MSTMTISVTGLPAPQGSKRHVGRGIMIESSKAVAPWREDVRAAALESANAHKWQPADTPTAVTILFYLPRPKGHYGTGRNAGVLRPSAPTFPAVMPDVDKLARATLDALTSAAVIPDDSRIVSLGAWKHYADTRNPGAEITITHLEDPDDET